MLSLQKQVIGTQEQLRAQESSGEQARQEAEQAAVVAVGRYEKVIEDITSTITSLEADLATARAQVSAR